MGCCICVEEAKVAVIERFGKYQRIVYPGCNPLNCFCENAIGYLSLRIEQYDLSIETRTKDNVFVTIKLAVRVKVAEHESEFPKIRKLPRKKLKKGEQPRKEEKKSLVEHEVGEEENVREPATTDEILYKAYYKLNNPIAQITTFIEQYFRFHGMEYTLDGMFEAQDELTIDLLNNLNTKVNPFGYIVHDTIVTAIIPNAKVIEAMNDVVASEKARLAVTNRAQAEKAARILAAEAEAKTRELEGQGVANARRAIIQGLRKSVDDFQQAIPGAEARELLVTVLMTQYMDTIKEAASKGRNTFILPSNPTAGPTAEDELRQAILSTERQEGPQH